MNIWALKKDIVIKHLLLLLVQSFGEDAFELIVEKEVDKAVRLIKQGDNSLSVYIYSYGQNPDCYGVHLEYPDLKETSLNNTLDIYDNVDYMTLCDLLQTHLDANYLTRDH